MSVERGWGRDVKDTVQRRGEKTASLPQSKLNASAETSIISTPRAQAAHKQPLKIETWMAGRNGRYPAEMKERFGDRIRQKIQDMETNPDYAKFLAKKARSRVVWTLVGIYFLIGFAPVLIPVIFSGAFLFVAGLILLPTLRVKLLDWMVDTLATFIAVGKTGKFNK